MKEMITNSVFFGVMVSILAYELGMLLKKKFKLAIFNPLLISIAVVIVILAVFHIDYQSYANGADLLSYLLTPATVCLASAYPHRQCRICQIQCRAGTY